MKKAISFILIVLLILGVLPLSACGDLYAGLEFVKIGEIDTIEDAKTKELIDGLSLLPDAINDGYDHEDDYICIITEEASGEVEIPAYYSNQDVLFVTAYPGAGAAITTLSIQNMTGYIEGVGNDDASAALTTTSILCAGIKNSFNICPVLSSLTIESESNGGLNIDNCFNSCDRLETVDLDNVMTVNDSFSHCSGIEAADIDCLGGATVTNSFNDCAAMEQLDLFSVCTISGSFVDCPALENVAIDTISTTTTESSINSSFLNSQISGSLEFETMLHEMSNSFNNCTLPETVAINASTDIIENSFNHLAGMKTLVITAEIGDISGSFNDCPELDNVRTEVSPMSVKDSFSNTNVSESDLQ